MKRTARLTMSVGNAAKDDADAVHAIAIAARGALVDPAVLTQGLVMRTLVHDLASALPGAQCDHNFGPGTDSWKVGGKLFAIATAEGVSVKCPDRETAAMLIEIGQAEPAPYLARGGWVQVTAAALAAGHVAAEDIGHRLAVSHATIVAALPRRLRPATEA